MYLEATMSRMHTFFTGLDTTDPCIHFEVNVTGYGEQYRWTVTRYFQLSGRRLGLLEPIYSEVFASAEKALEDAKTRFPSVQFN